MSVTFSIILILILLVLVALSISIIIWSIRNGISPMPTSSKAKKCLMSLLPDQIHGVIYELGSGWGTLTFPLARHYSKAVVIGFETSPVPFFVSWLRRFSEKAPNLCLKREDFFSFPIKDASLIICYLYPQAMQRLKLKFLNELKPGCVIISNTFAIPGWKPEKIIEVQDIYRSKIYVYIS
jgi:trans-aconitate methyltransferase